jgi:hypothetical protein
MPMPQKQDNKTKFLSFFFIFDTPDFRIVIIFYFRHILKYPIFAHCKM